MIDVVLPDGVNVIREEHIAIASIRVRDDKIIQINTVDKLLTLSELQWIHEINMKLTNREPYLFLHLTGKFTSVDEVGRQFLASKECLETVIAQAFVLHSLPQRLLANFFMTINKPLAPTQFFNDQSQAENWLQKQNK